MDKKKYSVPTKKWAGWASKTNGKLESEWWGQAAATNVRPARLRRVTQIRSNIFQHRLP